MDLIRSRVRPQTLVPPPLPASQAPEPEGTTGTPGLRGELGENAAAFLFGDGGSASHHPHRDGGTPLLLQTCLRVGPAPHGGEWLPRWGTTWSMVRGLGYRQGGRAGKVRERRTVGLKRKLNEKDRESGKDALLYPSPGAGEPS